MSMIDGINSQIVSVPSTDGYVKTNVNSNEAAAKDFVANEREIENVVAKSKDGDTLQENEESLKALSEGMVLKKTVGNDVDRSPAQKMLDQIDEEQSKKEEALKEEQRKERLKDLISDKTQSKASEQKSIDENENKSRVNSLIGMTKAQVEKLYKEGRISKEMYDSNMESREEKAQEIKEDTSTLDITMRLEENEKAAQTVKNIYEASQHDRADLAASIFN